MFASRNPASPTLADQASEQGTRALRSTQRAAQDALDQISQAVIDVRDSTAPVLHRISSQAESLARRGIDAVREGSLQLRDRADRVSTTTVAYVRDEPIKAALIATAVLGLALVTIASLASRSREPY